MNIYVASSWRNTQQPIVVSRLRQAGYDVYDFRAPQPGNSGFHWSDIDPEWLSWTPGTFRDALEHPIARDGLALDYHALENCDVCVLVLPSGRSAHIEAGFAAGQGKAVLVLLADGEPELMYGLAHSLHISIGELLDELEGMCEDNAGIPRED